MKIHLPIKILAFFLIFLVFGLRGSAILIEESYFDLVKKAFDILIVRVVRVEGPQYGEKVIARVERSLKGKYMHEWIGLPFRYEMRPGEGNSMVWSEDVVPVSFDVEKTYVVRIEKMREFKSKDPHAVKTGFQVSQYPKKPYFELAGKDDIRLWEIEQFLRIAANPDTRYQVNELITLSKHENGIVRNDAIEALSEMHMKDAIGPLISILVNSPDTIARFNAVRGLSVMQDRRIDTVFLNLMEHEKSTFVKIGIISSLRPPRIRPAIPILLKLYDSPEYSRDRSYDLRNAILTVLSLDPDSSIVSPLIGFYGEDEEPQHRHEIVKTVASIRSREAERFSSLVLDTCSDYWLKSTVMDGWGKAGYTKGFDKIARWVSVSCISAGAGQDHGRNQGLAFSLIQAIAALGTPAQIARTLGAYAGCEDGAVKGQALNTLNEQLKKHIDASTRAEIRKVIQRF